MTPTPAHQPEITLLNAVLDLPAGERAAHLDQACAGRPELRRRVEQLLAALERAGSFMAEPPGNEARSTVRDQPSAGNQPGDRIGRYKLLEKIGEGGCGVVYVAEQEEPVRRRVALKVIKPGMDSKSVIARFEAERQALAMMDHPNIARVFDAGTTDAGLPYFVMELVRGVPVTEYCNQARLPTTERLALFSQVCQAVQHAHQKGIIHRDLKPSNILVTLHDGVPVPKVIDFGIAKATEGRLTDKTIYTQLHQFIGTPAYMSPEQAEMSGLDIDTRSDIYSLGVLLYELLTGSTPFDAQEVMKSGLDALRKVIREQEPSRPSQRLSTLAGDALTTAARQRRVEGPGLIRQVRGDLDWIVMKCLEKDRNARYETASALATDIQRHLDNEPVTAVAPSFGYHWRKFHQRHKTQVRVAAALAALMVLGLGTSTWQAFRARRAERRVQRQIEAFRIAEKGARDQRERAGQTARVLEQLLEGARPSVARGRDTTILRDLMAGAERRIEAELGDKPCVKASLYVTLARGYREQHNFPKAEKMAREALRLSMEAHGPQRTHAHTLEALSTLAQVLSSMGNLAEAHPLGLEVISLAEQLHGPDSRQAADALLEHSTTLLERRQPDSLQEAERHLVRALEIYRRLQDREGTALVLGNLAGVRHERGDRTNALALQGEAHRLTREVLGDFHPNSLTSLADLAISLKDNGDLAGAEQAFRELLEKAPQGLGPTNAMIAHAQNGLARIAEARGRGDEAIDLTHQCLSMQLAVYGPRHPLVARTRADLAWRLYQFGPLQEAETSFREAIELMRSLQNVQDPAYSFLVERYGMLLQTADRPGAAEPWLREALSLRTNALVQRPYETAALRQRLGSSLLALDRAEEALQQFGQARALLDSHPAEWTNHPVQVEGTWTYLADGYRLAGHMRDAEQLYRLVRDRRLQRLPAQDAKTIAALQRLGEVLAGQCWPLPAGADPAVVQAQAREAETLLRQALAFAERGTNSSRGQRGFLRSLLGGSLAAQALTEPGLTGTARQDQLRAAEELLLTGQELMEQSTVTKAAHQLDGVWRIVSLYEGWAKSGPVPVSANRLAEWQRRKAALEQEIQNPRPPAREAK